MRIAINFRIEFGPGRRMRKGAAGRKSFTDIFQEYIDAYTLADKRNMRQALERFRRFLKERHQEIREAEFGPGRLTPALVQEYAGYLAEISRGSGAASTFRRFKKAVATLAREGRLPSDPCTGIRVPCASETLRKEVLNPEEIRQLLLTHYRGENPDIRRAFIFSLYTGIRWCDVAALTWGDIDFDRGLLTFTQKKTRGRSVRATVVMPLREDLMAVVGRPGGAAGATCAPASQRIFDLPSYTMCLKALRHWTARAGIGKHITWHCARHTFATLLVSGGADLVTTSRLLGHSGVEYVDIYAHALAEKERAAVELLPGIPEEAAL